MVGLKMSETLARDIGERGFHTVSGLARGIDTHAHKASLQTGTIAVLGGGVDDIYPPENNDLYHEIKNSGLIISESKMGYRAKAPDFPRRNRLIAGLARATIVVEAELRSGSLITARLALEANRDILAVPGSPLDVRARGSNDLIRRGAHLCETVDDILSILSPIDQTYLKPEASHHQGGLFEDLIDPLSWPLLPITDTDEPIDYDEASNQNSDNDLSVEIMALMGSQAMGRDWLIRELKAPASSVMVTLMDLEMQGLIELDQEGAYRKLV